MAKKQTEASSFIEKMKTKYGKGVVLLGNSIEESLEIVPSGSISLDAELGIGGIPIGKLIEILGFESSGKSSLTLEIISQFQKKGINCLLFDYEQSFDKKYAKSIGVDVDKLLVSYPESQEDGYNIIEEAISSKEVGLIVIDSHTAAMPRKVIEGEVGESTVGLQARINSVALGKIKPLLLSNKCTVIGISQFRQNIGGMGNPNNSTGGLSWKFYADIRLKVARSVDKLNENSRTTVEVIKNKCGIPFGKAEFNINWGEGIDKVAEVIDLAADYKLINKGGAWYTIEENKLQGINGVKAFMKDNPEYFEELKNKVIKILKDIKNGNSD